MTRITVLVLALGAAVAASAALGWWWVLTAPARRAQRWVATGTQAGDAEWRWSSGIAWEERS